MTPKGETVSVWGYHTYSKVSSAYLGEKKLFISHVILRFVN